MALENGTNIALTLASQKQNNQHAQTARNRITQTTVQFSVLWLLLSYHKNELRLNLYVFYTVRNYSEFQQVIGFSVILPDIRIFPPLSLKVKENKPQGNLSPLEKRIKDMKARVVLVVVVVVVEGAENSPAKQFSWRNCNLEFRGNSSRWTASNQTAAVINSSGDLVMNQRQSVSERDGETGSEREICWLQYRTVWPMAISGPGVKIFKQPSRRTGRLSTLKHTKMLLLSSPQQSQLG